MIEMAVASLVPVDSSLFELRQLHPTSVHPYLDVCVFLCSGRILARKQASFVRHERTAARLLCPVHDASRSVVSCACGPVGPQVRSGLPSVGVERQLATSKLYMSSVHSYPDGGAFI